MYILERINGMIAVLALSVAVLVVPSILPAAEIIVAPNPWVPELRSQDSNSTTGNLAGGIRFLNLPAEGEITIYTISGDFVKRIPFDSQNADVRWFGQNEEGDTVASGVYLWMVKSGAFVKKGKLVVVR